MTAVERDDLSSVGVRSSSAGDSAGARNGEADTVDWVAALGGTGPSQVSALRELHSLMIRAAGHQVWRMRAALPDPSPGAVDVIVNQAADEAMTALLGKLHTFQGRSRFTTWAFKFAILQAATEVRRLQWQHREVELRDLEQPSPAHDGPELSAEGTDLASAVGQAMSRVLTPYQRRIAVALLVDAVPIDVLAERLGTSRGALYKALHDVRSRLRRELTVKGYLLASQAHSPRTPQTDHDPTPSAGTP